VINKDFQVVSRLRRPFIAFFYGQQRGRRERRESNRIARDEAGKLPISTMSLKWLYLSFGFDKGPLTKNEGKMEEEKRKTSS